MSNLNEEIVTHVHHWNDTLFSFRTTRDPGFRFRNGHFTMLGLPADGRPLLRAYSIASANYEDQMEFFSIKVPDGPLTSRLQNLKVGDAVLVGRKPTGTLVPENLRPGKRLWLLGTGTGLAPFLSIIKDLEVYAAYDQIIVAHGVRHVSELAYRDLITRELPEHEYLGDLVRDKLRYYPTVTREPFVNQGRLTTLLESGRMTEDLGLSPLSPEQDRFMLCGSPAMLRDLSTWLKGRGFNETRQGHVGEFVIERAFVES